MWDICHNPQAVYGFCRESFPYSIIFHTRAKILTLLKTVLSGSDQAHERSSAAQQRFRGYFNRPASAVRTFGQGAIGWRSPCPIIPCSSGRVLSGEFWKVSRTVCNKHTQENTIPQERSYFGTKEPPLPIPSSAGYTSRKRRVFTEMTSTGS